VAPPPWLSLLERIADRADEIALRFFRRDGLRVEEKPDLSPVTEADRAIEESARELIRKHHPELNLLGEEYGATAGSDGAPRLIIDPIDGTRNFVRGIPVFATLLALEERGEIVAAVASAPALRTRWRAALGHGAFEGNRRLRVSGIRDLDAALVFHGSMGAGEAPLPPAARALIARADRTRGFGDFYQHVLVAQGAGELAIDIGLKPWDVAALLLIAEEAGGRATTVSGERRIDGGSLVTSNGLVHQAVLAALRDDAPIPS
jgi:histidinol-phosphatase